jgi:hypothetical protein
MKRLILPSLSVLIVLLLFTGCGSKNSEKKEEAISGKWYRVKGEMDSYSFQRDNSNLIFTGTSEESPVVYGSWKIDKDEIILTMDNGVSSTFLYSVEGDTLFFNKGQEIYTRTIPLELRFPEVRILNELTEDLRMKFSKPQPAVIKWSARMVFLFQEERPALPMLQRILHLTFPIPDLILILKMAQDHLSFSVMINS